MDNVTLIVNGVDYTCTPTPLPPPVSPTGLILAPVGIPLTVTPLDDLSTWTGEFDTATSGTAVGSTSYPVAVGGRTARQFSIQFTGNGGFRFHTTYGIDAETKNFIYAGDLYFPSVVGLGQMELDNNQVTADGATYIYGCQCNHSSGAWDITSTTNPPPTCHWNPTGVQGDPSTWPINTWLHFEIQCHRDDNGNITYDAIYFNGVTSRINATLQASLPLGWTPVGTLLVNFQLGGLGAGALNVYANNLQVAKW